MALALAPLTAKPGVVHLICSAFAGANMLQVVVTRPAVASPLVNPEAVHLVCSAIDGVKLVQVDAAGVDVDSTVGHTALDCPPCLPLIAPPVADI